MPQLGFGLMRLPMNGEKVDIEQTKKIADIFLEKGFCYFDTAFGYLNGESEKAAKENSSLLNCPLMSSMLLLSTMQRNFVKNSEI